MGTVLFPWNKSLIEFSQFEDWPAWDEHSDAPQFSSFSLANVPNESRFNLLDSNIELADNVEFSNYLELKPNVVVELKSNTDGDVELIQSVSSNSYEIYRSQGRFGLLSNEFFDDDFFDEHARKFGVKTAVSKRKNSKEVKSVRLIRTVVLRDK